MSFWTVIRNFFSAGASAAGGASGNPVAVVGSVAQATTATMNGVREGNRAATEIDIRRQKEEIDRQIEANIRKASQNGAALALCLLLSVLTGCASSAPSRDTGLSCGNVGRLMKRPDFGAAARAAPDWVEDALKTLNDREAALQREQARSMRLP